MLVLLPPSAGKTAPPSGPPVDFSALAYPQLTKLRRSLVAAADRRLRTASAAPAAEVYTGVLYGQLGLPDLDRAAWDRVRSPARCGASSGRRTASRPTRSTWA